MLATLVAGIFSCAAVQLFYRCCVSSWIGLLLGRLLLHMQFSNYFFLFSLIGIRYLILGAICFFIWYLWLRPKLAFKKIQLRFPKPSDYGREIGYSLITIGIFALVAFLLLYNDNVRQYTTFYADINAHSKWYFFAAFPLMFFMHDAYFYWMHRLMHHPALFKAVHLIHHKSVNPSPWAAYAFHPLEALVEAGILVVFLFTIPIHKFHLGLFFMFMITYNVYGHLGWELYPKDFNRTWIGKWVNTSVNHNQHHQFFKGNYGLYTLVWDRWMGTLRADYDQKFDEVKSRVHPTPVFEKKRNKNLEEVLK
jgi:sterol desaturase/sphingolipid hydroxylase (fatty acid hydroxylase superfamily)